MAPQQHYRCTVLHDYVAEAEDEVHLFSGEEVRPMNLLTT
tara:strand:+ start:1164 stop:1283 length:120 start_codon:yes stop_codon:yes gene_type:complete